MDESTDKATDKPTCWRCGSTTNVQTYRIRNVVSYICLTCWPVSDPSYGKTRVIVEADDRTANLPIERI